MFNTLQYTKKLEAVGIAREQAETHIQIIADIVEGNLATKSDLKELEFRLIIKLGAMMATMFTIAIAATAVIVNLH